MVLTYVEELALAWNVCDGSEVVSPVDWLAGNGGLGVILVAMV